eukprot:scaffold348230_cov48-Prasinocladus_malaysianus.AAC.1
MKQMPCSAAVLVVYDYEYNCIGIYSRRAVIRYSTDVALQNSRQPRPHTVCCSLNRRPHAIF